MSSSFFILALPHDWPFYQLTLLQQMLCYDSNKEIRYD